MTTRPYATTNARLEEACVIVEELVNWAIADAEHAFENDAPDTGRDDLRRASRLGRALAILMECKR